MISKPLFPTPQSNRCQSVRHLWTITKLPDDFDMFNCSRERKEIVNIFFCSIGGQTGNFHCIPAGTHDLAMYVSIKAWMRNRKCQGKLKHWVCSCLINNQVRNRKCQVKLKHCEEQGRSRFWEFQNWKNKIDGIVLMPHSCMIYWRNNLYLMLC